MCHECLSQTLSIESEVFHSFTTNRQLSCSPNVKKSLKNGKD